MFQCVPFTLYIFICLMFCACSPIKQADPSLYTKESRYISSRTKFEARDSLNRYSPNVAWSVKEESLNQKWIVLREEMIKEYQDQHFFPPAKPFYQSKEHIEQTNLFQILRKMPKGGLLHLHGSASGSIDWIIDTVQKMANCYVFWPNAAKANSNDPAQLNTSAPIAIKGQFRFFQAEAVPQGYVSFPQLSRQIPQFEDSLRKLIVFDETIFEDSINIWQAFENRFQRLSGITNYQPLFKPYYLAALESLQQDGIQHVELREFLHPIEGSLYDLEHPPGYFSADTIISYFQEIEKELQQRDPFFTLRLIYTNLRFRHQVYIQEDLVYAFQTRQKYPNFILGYDLVAHEDAGNSTLHFLPTWLKLDSLEKVYQTAMPLYLHDGESHWELDNLYDAVLLNTERIGHGFNLYRYPSLFDVIKKREIALEINPLSNQILGYLRDLRLHPAISYIARGIPCTLSSDDPLIFDYEGMSYDFWTATLAWQLNLRDLKQLSYHSLAYSGLNEREKERSINEWKKRWIDFVDQLTVQLEDGGEF